MSLGKLGFANNLTQGQVLRSTQLVKVINLWQWVGVNLGDRIQMLIVSAEPQLQRNVLMDSKGGSA